MNGTEAGPPREPGAPIAAARPAEGWRSEVAFLRRTLIVVGVIVLLLFLWTIRGALLLAFAAVLVAVLIRAVADPLRDRLKVPAGLAVLLACLAIGLPLVVTFMLLGSEMRAQVMLLLENLPEAAATLESELGLRIPVPGGDAAGATPDASTVGEVARQAAFVALVAVDAVAALLIVVAGGVYFAAQPDQYRRGIARLLPRAQQARGQDALDASGRALRLWLIAQLIAMLVVGTLTGLGAWALGLPAPLALGLFAGLVDIIPLIGPFIGALPGLLLAFNMGWEMVAWAALLYLAIQQIEGNVLLPVLGQRMVAIPSALLLFAVVAAGATFGLGGVLLAAPLTVVVVVLVGKLYVRETLGKPVEVPGEGQE